MSLRIVAYVFTILFLIMLLFPIYWLFTTSTKDVMQSYETPPEMFPTMPYTYEVYLEVPDGYTAEDFREDSAYLAWPVANECTNRRFAGLRIMAGYNGMIQYKCEISSSDFKLYKSELFPGAVSVNIIRNTMEKVLSVMEREKMFSLNSSGVYAQRVQRCGGGRSQPVCGGGFHQGDGIVGRHAAELFGNVFQLRRSVASL